MENFGSKSVANEFEKLYDDLKFLDDEDKIFVLDNLRGINLNILIKEFGEMKQVIKEQEELLAADEETIVNLRNRVDKLHTENVSLKGECEAYKFCIKNLA